MLSKVGPQLDICEHAGHICKSRIGFVCVIEDKLINAAAVWSHAKEIVTKSERSTELLLLTIIKSAHAHFWQSVRRAQTV